MSMLHEIQARLQLFIAEGDARACADDVAATPAIATDRLGIFRNNSLVTHTRVLAAVFPVVCRLVDPGFFAYLVHEFLRHNPPAHPCLSEYGETFPEFVANFPPVMRIVYLEDIARLEWAISRAASVPAPQSVSLNEFASRPADPALARLKLDSSVRFVASEYPIDLIWQMNQSDNEVEAATLEERPAYLEVRGGRTEILRRLDKPDWVFRSLISSGDALGVAIETTLHFEPRFDLAGAIARLFAEGLVVSCEP
jgi:hypothetical protein